MNAMPLDVAPEVATALANNRPVVALESTLIAHGLPWPLNLATAREAEAAVRGEGAIPATVATWRGRLRVGLVEDELEELAHAKGLVKASRRDLAAILAAGRSAATTVAATMAIAHWAGIRFFATGGIGGVHRGACTSFDVSADLFELSRTPVAVVCAGVKSILDAAATLEMLETLGVPLVGYQTDVCPAFYVVSSGLPVQTSCATPVEVASLAATHWRLQGGGIVVAVPPPDELALSPDVFDQALARAEREARDRAIAGKDVTPFLLQRIADHTEGRSLEVNRALVVNNARLAARIAAAFTSP